MIEPDHLLDQADALLVPRPDGTIRQTDRRRAVSASYYAVFHAGLMAAADEFLGADERGTEVYGLVYRSVDHGKIKNLNVEVLKSSPSPKYKRYQPNGGYGHDIQAFASSFNDLYEARMTADYNPAYVVTPTEAQTSISTARSAIARLRASAGEARRTFLALMLFPPR